MYFYYDNARIISYSKNNFTYQTSLYFTFRQSLRAGHTTLQTNTEMGIRNVELRGDGGYCINSNTTLVDDFEFFVTKWVTLMATYRSKTHAQADLKDNKYFHK